MFGCVPVPPEPKILNIRGEPSESVSELPLKLMVDIKAQSELAETDADPIAVA
jgi:hypothetical protein